VAQRVVFSLWSGPLPAISELHFRSVLHHLGEGEYHLFLDDSPGYEGIVTEDFRWLESDPRVHIRRISVMDYLRSHGITLPDNPRHLLSTATVRWWLRRWFAVVLWWEKIAAKLSRNPRGEKKSLPHGVHNDPEFGITAGHGFSAWRQEEDLSYRADIFRVLAPEFFPTADVLWLDLDIAVFQDLNWLGEKALVYRWGTYPFGNNAVIHLPASAPAARSGLIAAMNALGAARPWTLFSDRVCEDLGFVIADVDEFDPPFTAGHVLHDNYAGLFDVSKDAEALASDLLGSLKMLHWHNSWKLVPPAESAYGIMLARYRNLTLPS
jgi:hypothetical protein